MSDIIEQIIGKEILDALTDMKHEPKIDSKLTEKQQVEAIIADYLYFKWEIPYEILGRVMWIS